MKTKILFIKHILRDNNLLKEIFLQQYDNKKCKKWITQINKGVFKGGVQGVQTPPKFSDFFLKSE